MLVEVVVVAVTVMETGMGEVHSDMANMVVAVVIIETRR